MASPRIGIWLIGAKGGVAATTIVGLVALKKGLTETTGLIGELPQFRHLDFAPWDAFVIGGHEIRKAPLRAEAARVVTDMRAATSGLLDQCRQELDEIDGRIRPGTIHNVGPTITGLADMAIPPDESPRQIVGRLQQDLREFIEANRLEHAIVVNVASTEPPMNALALPETWAGMERLLDCRGEAASPGCPLPASSLYAIASLDLGCSYVNFTPSLGSAPAAIDELARLRGTRHIGCDGKTGETLLKSVLAPMFARRNLEVLSWVGHNIFGNMDGRVLDDPDNKRAKIASKDHLLAQILGYRPQTHVSIEYIESLGDWKTAWDHIHFAGFLGTPMTLQFTWNGSDSVLAAPLVLDLVRFTELSWRRGQTGALTFLASFFKSPYGVEEQGFDRQYQMLEDWAASASAAGSKT
jgi:myo-inositol-1-phosphate synthase